MLPRSQRSSPTPSPPRRPSTARRRLEALPTTSPGPQNIAQAARRNNVSDLVRLSDLASRRSRSSPLAPVSLPAQRHRQRPTAPSPPSAASPSTSCSTLPSAAPDRRRADLQRQRQLLLRRLPSRVTQANRHHQPNFVDGIDERPAGHQPRRPAGTARQARRAATSRPLLKALPRAGLSVTPTLPTSVCSTSAVARIGRGLAADKPFLDKTFVDLVKLLVFIIITYLSTPRAHRHHRQHRLRTSATTRPRLHRRHQRQRRQHAHRRRTDRHHEQVGSSSAAAPWSPSRWTSTSVNGAADASIRSADLGRQRYISLTQKIGDARAAARRCERSHRAHQAGRWTWSVFFNGSALLHPRNINQLYLRLMPCSRSGHVEGYRARRVGDLDLADRDKVIEQPDRQPVLDLRPHRRPRRAAPPPDPDRSTRSSPT